MGRTQYRLLSHSNFSACSFCGCVCVFCLASVLLKCKMHVPASAKHFVFGKYMYFSFLLLLFSFSFAASLHWYTWTSQPAAILPSNSMCLFFFLSFVCWEVFAIVACITQDCYKLHTDNVYACGCVSLMIYCIRALSLPRPIYVVVSFILGDGNTYRCIHVRWFENVTIFYCFYFDVVCCTVFCTRSSMCVSHITVRGTRTIVKWEKAFRAFFVQLSNAINLCTCERRRKQISKYLLNKFATHSKAQSPGNESKSVEMELKLNTIFVSEFNQEKKYCMKKHRQDYVSI